MNVNGYFLVFLYLLICSVASVVVGVLMYEKVEIKLTKWLKTNL